MFRANLFIMAVAAVLIAAAVDSAAVRAESQPWWGQNKKGAAKNASGPQRTSDRPQVRATKKSGGGGSELPGRRGPAGKKTSDVAPKLACEGGQIKTASNGVRGCSCGLNVSRVVVGKNHFRCDNPNRPQVRKSSVTKSSADLPGRRGPTVKPSSEVKKAVGSTGRPVNNNQTSSGKPVKQCGSRISVTRLAAVTRVGGKATAEAGWAQEVKKNYPRNWGNWNNAKDRNTSCKFAGTWNCTATARPCEP